MSYALQVCPISSLRKRLLFITYYFPPSGGPGVQRALKFARYLPEFGWEPTVLTVRPEDAAYPDLDPSLACDIPPGLQVERTAAWDPYSLYARLQGKQKSETVGVGFVGEGDANWKHRLGRWMRANLFLPDARVGWVPYLLRRAHQLQKTHGFDAVLTTGPPHSQHLAGWRLSAAYGLPWLADFRDPWTGIDFYDKLPLTDLARRIDGALERNVLRRAAAVTVVSPSMRDKLREVHRRDYHVLFNGFDPADFTTAPPPLEDNFTISYVGNLNDARNPDALWKALRALDTPATMPRFRVRLVGNVDPLAVEQARQHGVDGSLETRPYVPHGEAVQIMQRSHLLLLVINRVAGAEGIMTGKLYEYLAAGRPVLGIGPVHGDAAAVLRETGGGELFDYDDPDGVASFIRSRYDAWARGDVAAGAPPEAVAAFSRRGQTERLAAILDTIAGRGPA